MTKTEYIGARYTPIFADPVEWSSARAYEPLTIVTYGNDSYTSKRAVPIGVEITDTEYWVRTSTGNPDISGIDERLMLLGGQIESVDRKYQLKFPVSVEDGGTGSTTAEQARANLGVPATGGSLRTLYDVEQVASTAKNAVDSILPQIRYVYRYGTDEGHGADDELWGNAVPSNSDAAAQVARVGDIVLFQFDCQANLANGLEILRMPDHMDLQFATGVAYTDAAVGRINVVNNAIWVEFGTIPSGKVNLRGMGWGIKTTLTIQPDSE